MRYPEFLSEGGTIGFVAPSFGCATEPYKTAFGMTIKRFEKEGYPQAPDASPSLQMRLHTVRIHLPYQQSCSVKM